MKLKNFFEKIIRRDTAESSKRVVALAVLVLVIYIVLRFTNLDNFIQVLNSLLIFLSALLGISSLETVSLKQSNDQSQKDGSKTHDEGDGS